MRPVYAGNAICTVQSSDERKLLTVRQTNFDAAPSAPDSSAAAVLETLDVSSLLGDSQGRFVENVIQESERPDLTAARVVVSGGRALKNSENF